MSGFLCSMVGATFTVAAAAEVIRAKKSITAVGNASVSTTQSKFGGTSAAFDNTGDYLTTAYSSDFNFTTGSFTIECWCYPTDDTAEIISNYEYNTNNGWSLGLRSSGRILWVSSDGSTGLSVSGLSPNNQYTLNAWNHIAITRSGTTLKCYVNGTEQWSATISNIDSSTGGLSIGRGYGASSGLFTDGPQDYGGYLDEIRISNSVRYTANFTAPTAPFQNDANTVLLMHCDGTNGSTAFYDDNGQRSPKGIIANGNAQTDFAQSKFGSSSALFDGTDDYLKVSPGITFTGDFTVEWWMRPSNVSGNKKLFQIGDEASGRYSIDQYYERISVNLYGSGTYDAQTGVLLSSNTWYHIAVVRSGGTTTIYIDGTSRATNSAGATTFGNSGDLWIGVNSSLGDDYNGHLDEIRISNSARYTTTFTPSTTPFVNDTNTLLLLHMNAYDGATVFTDDNQNASYTPLAELTDDSSTELLLHMNGSAGGTTFTDDNSTGRTAKTITRYTVTTETAQKKFGTASMLGSTSGAYGLVVTGTNNLLQWYNADFCAEAWIYPTSYTSINGGTYGGIPTGKVIGNMARAGGGNYWGFGPTSTGALSWYMWDPSIGSRGFVTTSTPITLNTWHHIAVQHDLGRKVLTIFCNGVKLDEWAWTYNGNVTSDNATGLSIGAYDSVGFPGYIDDVRVSRCLRY